MANPPRRCIFCGGFGVTKEHVFPDWLRAIFPRLPTDTHTFGSLDMVHMPTVGHVFIPQRKQGQGQAGVKTVKVVCGPCNNGWLSAMEEETKPLLERMVYGSQGILGAAEQKQLAVWIAKTTMTAEYLMPKEVAIYQMEREEFRQRREPGSHWKIWIGFYTGGKWHMGGIFHQGIGIYLPPKPIRVGVKNTQYTVIGLGRLIAISLSSEEDGLAFGMHDQVKVALKQIWPLGGSDIVWPLEWSIDDAAFEAIVGAFGKALGVPIPSL
jgi:hypothetical protein